MIKPKWLILLLLFPILGIAQPMKTVFPGDTNNDGICNHYDLLPIGLTYNEVFEPREPASLDWIPQSFLSWLDSLPVSEVNTGFSDCDGNGIVDDLDMDAFPLNYDSTQSASIPPPADWLAKLTDTLVSSAMPRLRLSFDKAIANQGDTLRATLTYSIPPTHPTGALGVAIWLTYPTENVVDSEVRIEADTNGNDLLYVGATSNAVNIWRNIPPGNLQFAAAGRGQNDLMGDDTLGCFIIIIEDKIIAAPEPFMLECKEALLLNADEQVLPFVFEKDSVELEMQVGIEESENQLGRQVLVSPNPFQDQLTIDSPVPIREALLLDKCGRMILSKTFVHENKLDWLLPAYLPDGFYTLQLLSSNANFAKKVVKISR